jgi:FkbM family methyltransferase
MSARRVLRALRHLAAAFGVLCADSRLRFLGLRLGLGSGRGPVPLRLKALDGHALWVRPGTSDAMVVVEDFVHGFADPPAEVDRTGPTRMVELGSNIGAGLAGLAHRYPDASVLGIETDSGNAALARRNLAPWADRCRLVEAAVWEGPGRPVVDHRGGRESGYTVRSTNGSEAPTAGEAGGGERRSLTVDELLADFHPGEPIDYMYLDIEGTHAQLLRGEARWLDRVRAIKVSRHLETPYSEEDCARDLRRLGFRARVVPQEPTGCTIRIRE